MTDTVPIPRLPAGTDAREASEFEHAFEKLLAEISGRFITLPAGQ